LVDEQQQDFKTKENGKVRAFGAFVRRPGGGGEKCRAVRVVGGGKKIATGDCTTGVWGVKGDFDLRSRAEAGVRKTEINWLGGGGLV